MPDRSINELWAELEALRQTDPVVQRCLHMYECGSITGHKMLLILAIAQTERAKGLHDAAVRLTNLMPMQPLIVQVTGKVSE